jgi:hypothetical protein
MAYGVTLGVRIIMGEARRTMCEVLMVPARAQYPEGLGPLQDLQCARVEDQDNG